METDRRTSASGRGARSSARDAVVSWRVLPTAGFIGVAIVALFRSRSRWLRAACAGLLAASSAAPTLGRARTDYRRQRALPTRRHVRATVAAAFEAIIRSCPTFDVSDITVQAFVVRRRGLGRSSRLQRLEGIRIAQLPPPSRVQWTKGKGVLGRCWLEGRILVCDFEELYQPYHTDADWELAGEAVRMGLSWPEVTALTQRYAGVVAVPVRNPAGDVAGVITMDCLKGADFQRFLKDGVALRETVVALASAARVAGRLLAEFDDDEALWH